MARKAEEARVNNEASSEASLSLSKEEAKEEEPPVPLRSSCIEGALRKEVGMAMRSATLRDWERVFDKEEDIEFRKRVKAKAAEGKEREAEDLERQRRKMHADREEFESTKIRLFRALFDEEYNIEYRWCDLPGPDSRLFPDTQEVFVWQYCEEDQPYLRDEFRELHVSRKVFFSRLHDLRLTRQLVGAKLKARRRQLVELDAQVGASVDSGREMSNECKSDAVGAGGPKGRKKKKRKKGATKKKQNSASDRIESDILHNVYQALYNPPHKHTKPRIESAYPQLLPVATVAPLLRERVRLLEEEVKAIDKELRTIENESALRCRAAEHITRVWRGALTRMAVLRKRMRLQRRYEQACALKLQRVFRGFAERRLRRTAHILRQLLHQRRALTIQRVLRGHLGRCETRKEALKQLKAKRLRCAIALQSFWRGTMARSHARVVLQEKQEEERKANEKEAATEIQRIFRGWTVRRRAADRRIELKCVNFLFSLSLFLSFSFSLFFLLSSSLFLAFFLFLPLPSSFSLTMLSTQT